MHNQDRVIKNFEAKERPRFNPLIVHLFNKEELDKYADEVPENFLNCMINFPRTYNLRFKKEKIIPDIVTAGNETVAVRFPSHNIFRELLKKVNVPIAALRRIVFGRISPTSAEDVKKKWTAE